MNARPITKSVLLASLLTGAFLFNASSFAATNPSKPMTPVGTSKPAPVNAECKKSHPDIYSQSYKECVKKADAAKK